MVPFDQIVGVNRSEIVEGFEINEKKSCFIAPFIMLSFSGNNEHLQCTVSLTSSNGAAGNVSLVGTFGASAAAVCVCSTAKSHISSMLCSPLS